MSEIKSIECDILVPASIKEVWQAWTTVDGARSFFSPDARIDPVPGGPYEILFNPSAPPGSQGAEEMIILAMQEPTFLSFTWNAPPHLPDVRGHRTVVEIRLESIAADSTKVSLRHTGWGIGGQWDQAFEYFSNAWPRVVLPRLKYRFEQGPVDWSNPPSF